MAQLNLQLKAFTIFESMVAMVIIMIVFGMSSVVIINVSSSGITKEKQDAYTLVNLLRNETLHQHRYLDETIEVGKITIEKTIIDYPANDGLKTLLIKAQKGKKTLFESKELVLVNTVTL